MEPINADDVAEQDSNREAQLLYGNTDKYGIYQLKDNLELNQCHLVSDKVGNFHGNKALVTFL